MRLNKSVHEVLGSKDREYLKTWGKERRLESEGLVWDSM